MANDPATPSSMSKLPGDDQAELSSTISGRDLTGRLFRGLLWAISAKGLGITTGLLANALLARMLSTEAMGSYFLIVSVVGFAAVFARFGLQQTVVRLVAESLARGVPGRARQTLRWVYAIAAVGSLLVGGMLWLGGAHWLARNAFDDPLIAGVGGLIAIWVAILAFRTPVAETFRGLHDVRMASYLGVALPSCFMALAVGTVWLLNIDVDLDLAVLISVVAAGATLALGAALLSRQLWRLQGPGTIQLSELLKMSAPVFVINLGNLAAHSGSLWVAGVFLTGSDVALFGAAMKLVTLVTVPLTLVVAVVQPVIVQLNNEHDKPRLQRALRATATLAALPAVVVLFGYALFGRQLLGLVFGAPYAEASVVLVVLVLGHLVNVWTGACGNVLMMTGHQRQAMNQLLLNGLFTAVACVVGAKLAGLVGLATAVALGTASRNLLNWWLAHRLTGLWTHALLNPKELRATARSLIVAVRERRDRSKGLPDAPDENLPDS